jgi:hypothetical protein
MSDAAYCVWCLLREGHESWCTSLRQRTAEDKVREVYPQAFQRHSWIYNVPFGKDCRQIGRSWIDAAEKLEQP